MKEIKFKINNKIYIFNKDNLDGEPLLCVNEKDMTGEELFENDIVEFWPKYEQVIEPAIGQIKWDSGKFIIEEIKCGTIIINDKPYELYFYDYDGAQFNWNELKKIKTQL